MRYVQDLTFSQASGRAIEVSMNGITQCKAQVNLAKYPPETAKILQRDIFWFFLRDEDFVSKTISDGSVDLEKFPASKVRQLAKKLESSKATNTPYKASSEVTRKLHKLTSLDTSAQSYQLGNIKRKEHL